MKRLLCILSGMNRGGAETFLMKLYRNLDRTSYQMDFCINNSEKQAYENEIIKLGGRVYRIPSKSDNLQGFKRALFDVIHDNGYKYVLRITSNAMGFLDLKIAAEAGAEVLAVRSSNAGGEDSVGAKIAHWIGRLLYGRYINKRIAPSDLAAIHTFGRRAYKNGQVLMLRNALDLSIYKYDAESRKDIRGNFEIPQDAVVFGHVGRFQRQKNHEFLIRVFAQLYNNDERNWLLLVGDGELRDQVKKQVDDLGVSGRVVFAGVQANVSSFLSAMDVLLLPSFFEGMPNVVIEAQATGLPCVISDTITMEANISGKVTYISLDKKPESWARLAAESLLQMRYDATQNMIARGYEIKSAVRNFEKYIFQ